MKISEVIRELEIYKETYGDIEVLSDDSSWDEIYQISVKQCLITKQNFIIIE